MALRPVALALAVAVALAGCDGDVRPGDGERPAHQSSASARPGPAERLGLATGWGPSETELERAARLVRALPLRELAGQVIVASYAGTGSPTGLVDRLHLGGVIAFSDNIRSTGQIRRVNTRLQAHAHRPWPVRTSVDQDGGLVQRVQGTATRFPTFMSTGAARDATLTRAAYAASGAELRRLGFTVDLAPDADVTSGPADPTIGARSAGSDPDLVARQALAAAQGFLGAGVVPVLKHFPGHGSVPADSHRTLPVQTRSLRSLRSHDLVPFRRAVGDGMPAVMVGHIDLRAVDPGTPSSVSHQVITGVLRDQLGFDGLVVTDALEMAAVRATYDGAPASVRALRAGADVLLMPPDPTFARAGIVRAVRDGRLRRTRLEQAAARMVALLLHQQGLPGHGAAPGTGRRASEALSAAAITSVAGPCRGRLFRHRLVPVGDPTAVAAFTTAARAAGISLGRVTYRKPPRPPRHQHHKLRRWRRLEPTPVYHGQAVDLVGYHQLPVAGAPIVVATDTPYALGSTDARVRIATYGDTPGAMRALVDVLRGHARAPGRLPVRVAGVPRSGC